MQYDLTAYDIDQPKQSEKTERCNQCQSQTYYTCKKCDVALHVKCSPDYHSDAIEKNCDFLLSICNYDVY